MKGSEATGRSRPPGSWLSTNRYLQLSQKAHRHFFLDSVIKNKSTNKKIILDLENLVVEDDTDFKVEILTYLGIKKAKTEKGGGRNLRRECSVPQR